jgi:hypothetical protein
MDAPLKEKDDIKIFILYLLRNMNVPLEFTTINDIVVQDGIVNYFDFADCFAELLDAGNILEIKAEGSLPSYNITEQGINVADTLNSRILRSIRERSLRSAYRLLDFNSRGAKSSSDIIENPDGSLEFHCEIKEPGKNILSLNVSVDNMRQLEQMQYYFNEYTEEIYTELVSLLSGDKKIELK